MTILIPAQTIIKDGRRAELRRARKYHRCNHCQLLINKGDSYYSVTYAGAGLGSIKFPSRCHQGCLEEFLNGNHS